MKCPKCGCKPRDHGPSFIPIDPPGKNRRWICTDCANDEQMRKLDPVSKDLMHVLGGIEVPE